MQDCREFMELFRLCQSTRKVMGLGALEIPDDIMAQCELVEAAKADLPDTCKGSEHGQYDCTYCRKVGVLMEGLVARLAAAGIALPPGVLEER